jgi:hypothetical protein
VLGPVTAHFELGRPPGMKVGQSQRFQMVLRGPFLLPKPGAFHWALVVDGERKAMTRFWVDQVTLPAPPASAPQAGP